MTSGHDAYIADRYHQECLALLIPMLDDSTAVLDEALFATTVVLRLYEEISGRWITESRLLPRSVIQAKRNKVPFAGRDYESHLMGTHTFVRAVTSHQPSGIRHAALRVVLRQEVVVAFRSQRPIQMLQEYLRADKSLDDQADDWSSAFHIIVLCAEVLTCCYGDEPKTTDVWMRLADRARAWIDSKAVSFEPLLHRSQVDVTESAHVFPEIWLLNDCHGACLLSLPPQAWEAPTDCALPCHLWCAFACSQDGCPDVVLDLQLPRTNTI